MSIARESSSRPDIWGGLECSFNRVRDHYRDQLHFSGHYRRARQDVEAVATLGITKIRYPVIWERLQPRTGQSIDWSTAAVALDAFRKHRIDPIAGLVHHGSGPPYAHLLSPAFFSGLTAFAHAVATRFPWIQYYTPVNEPLTTARFCCLYGFWYPHLQNDRAFVRALLTEMKAVVLAMQEVRKVNPLAKLVQTEDLAKVYSTPRLQYQADFENHRRWLTFDLLCGKVDRYHPLWHYLLHSGATERDMAFFSENRCPPDLLGLDYYATSERYLDEALELYPPECCGGNGRDQYADVEAFRVPHGQPSGIKVLLEECWDRYQLPMALTEVHIGCDPENQIRWFAAIRRACMELNEEGIDIRAVTAWSLLGCFGWNRLLMDEGGNYETGAFDIRSGIPEPTPLAAYIARLSKDPAYVHPAEAEKGWWHRDDRFIYADPVLAGGNLDA